MAKLTVEGVGTFEVDSSKRLAAAMREAGIDHLHACGGKARCTTCRVSFASGEPDTMTSAEHAKLKERDMLGNYRLACQIAVTHDMSVTAHVTLETMPDWTDTGPRCTDEIEPDAIFIKVSDLS